jgi:hypothetical protein
MTAASLMPADEHRNVVLHSPSTTNVGPDLVGVSGDEVQDRGHPVLVAAKGNWAIVRILFRGAGQQIAAQRYIVHIIDEQHWGCLDERGANAFLKLSDITARVKRMRGVAKSDCTNCSDKQTLATACT